jgi:type I restriction enzyme S subunit
VTAGVVVENLEALANAPDGMPRLRGLILDLAVNARLCGTDAEWRATQLRELVVSSGAGWSPSCDARPRGGDEWGVLKVSAVSWGQFQPDENKALPSTLSPRPELEVQPGDFLVSRANTAELVARSVVVESTPPKLMLSDKIVRLRLSDACAPRFVQLANSAPEARRYYARVAGGTSSSMKNVSREQILALPILLPPLSEQHRIVAKVDELMALCDRLEARQQDAKAAHARLVQALLDSLTQARDADEFQACWHRLADQLTGLITSDAAAESLKSVVVELAVRGRLVPQVPADEPGTVLLQRLIAAKRVAARDARKQKEITAGDLPAPPFDAPAGWNWTHLDQVLAISGGVTLGRKLSGRSTTTAPYLRVANVQRGRLDLTEVKKVEVPSDEIEKYRLERGDLLITEGGDWDKVGRTAVWADELPLCLHQNHVFRGRRCSEELDLRWVELYLNSPTARDYFAGASKQTTNLASINMTQLRSCAFAVPPLAEQGRIVAKVTELLALCDLLKARIAAARAKHTQLAEALVAQAVTT